MDDTTGPAPAPTRPDSADTLDVARTPSDSNSAQIRADTVQTRTDSVHIRAGSDARASIDSISTSFRAGNFAKRSMLSPWFPRINDDETNSRRIWWSRRSRVLVLQTAIILVIFIVNLSFTTFALSKYGSNAGAGLLFEGDCNTVKRLSLWMHLVINLLSTGMLGASNYCMQLQVAPTRAMVDKAHAEGRILIWSLLAVSSVPIHLLYNSGLFQSLSSNDYAVAVVTDSFLAGAPWNLETAKRNFAGNPSWDEDRVSPAYLNYTAIYSEMQQNHGAYKQMNTSSCFKLYNDYWTPQGNVIVLVSNGTADEAAGGSSLLMYVYVVPRWDDWGKNMWALANGTDQFVAQLPPDPVTEWCLGPSHYQVASCLVQDPDAIRLACRFEYSPHILITICVMNLVKAAILTWVWLTRRHEPTNTDSSDTQVLYTLGDAIASFMRVPDPTTRNMCLATKYDFARSRRRWYSWRSQPPDPATDPREFRQESRRWMQAASTRRWSIMVTGFSLVIIICGILLSATLKSIHYRKFVTTTWAEIITLGFGALTPYTYLVINIPRSGAQGLIFHVLLANLPQLVLSVVYIMYNAMLSTFLVQSEFSLMYKGTRRKTLRVSQPVGIQRSSFFISLPWRYGLPLYASSGIMHFLISQSFFLARITAVFPNGGVDHAASFSTCAFSPLALIISMIFAAGLVLAIAMAGLRRYDGTMRMVASNSRAISAACHVLEEDRADGYLLPLQWGVVQSSGGVGSCTFTTAPDSELTKPQEGRMFH